MNYYRRYSGDYLRDTARLNLAEHGAYSLMLDYIYSEERPLPADLSEVYLLLRAMTPRDKKAVDKVLDTYFTLQDDGWHQARADREIATSQRARENGEKGGRGARRKTQSGTQKVTQTRTQTRTQSGTESGTQNGTETVTDDVTHDRTGSRHPPTTNHQPPTTNPGKEGNQEGGGCTEVGNTPARTRRSADG